MPKVELEGEESRLAFQPFSTTGLIDLAWRSPLPVSDL
jgi:hypothetical protein